MSAFIWSNIASKREREELGAVETKVIRPGKTVPYKCCLPSWNISVRTDFDTDVLLTNIVSHFQVLAKVMF